MMNPPLTSMSSSTSQVTQRNLHLVLLQIKKPAQAQVTFGISNPLLNPNLTPKTRGATSGGSLPKEERGRWGKLTNMTLKDDRKTLHLRQEGNY